MDREQAVAAIDAYLEAFVACGRGERDVASLLSHYGVPMLFTTDERVSVLASEEEVIAAAAQQVDGLPASGYHHSEILEFEVTELNAASALYRGSFARLRGDGSEIARLTATYLLTVGQAGPRISVLAVHSR